MMPIVDFQSQIIMVNLKLSWNFIFSGYSCLLLINFAMRPPLRNPSPRQQDLRGLQRTRPPPCLRLHSGGQRHVSSTLAVHGEVRRGKVDLSGLLSQCFRQLAANTVFGCAQAEVSTVVA